MTGEHSLADRIAKQVHPGAVIERVDPVEPGNRRRTAVVRFADADPIVIQVGTDPQATRVEARLLDAIGERTSVPVPTPLGNGTVDGVGWLATPLIGGDDLHRSFAGLDPGDRRRIARSFGRYLAELHDAFRFGICGPVGAVDGNLVVEGSEDPAAVVGGGAALISDGGSSDDSSDGDGATAAEWETWFPEFVRSGLARLPSEFDAVRDDVRDALEGFDAESAPVPRLFPWDLRPGNALIADGRVAAVLDWEGPLAAVPPLSVAKTEYLVADWYVGSDEAEPLREAFRAGYGSVREFPDVRPIHRVAAVVSTAVDSRGAVTNPGYPPVSRADAVRFHRRALQEQL